MSNWKYRVTSPRTGDFETDRDAFVAALRASTWAKDEPVVRDYADELDAAEDAEEFDWILDELYDVADDTRCWITFERIKEV